MMLSAQTKCLTTAALLSAPGLLVQHRSQQGVLQGHKTLSLLSEGTDHSLRIAPEQHLTPPTRQNRNGTQVEPIVLHWLRGDTAHVTSGVHLVAFGCEGGGGDQRPVGCHGNFARVPSHVGLLKQAPDLLTVGSGEQSRRLSDADRPLCAGKG